VAAKVVVAAVFAATAALCAYRAAVPAATPHRHIPDLLLTVGFATTGLLAAVLCACAALWALRGPRFADTALVAVVWPIATVLLVIAAGASAIPQHYLDTGLVLVPAGVLAVAMMVAVGVVYNATGRR
jgi:hypothetical protein